MKLAALKKFPLGLPLLGLSAATAATYAKKPIHIAIGAAWLGFSALHGMQHAEKLRQDAKCLLRLKESAKKGVEEVAESAAWTTRNTYLHIVFAGTEVVSALPDRIRLRNRAIIGNDELAEKVTDFVTSHAGVESAVTDLTTGSMVIHYDAKEIQKNPKLAAAEKYFRHHAKIVAA